MKSDDRLLFFALDGVGGAERVMVTVAKQLLKRGRSITFVLIRNSQFSGASLETLLPSGVECRRIFWDGQIKFMRDLKKAVETVNPAVVFSSAMHINQRLLLLKPFFRDVKFIVRNDNYLYTLPPLKRLCLKLTYRFAECVIAQTEEMGAEVSMFVDAGKVHVLDNPIDEELIGSKLRAPSPFAYGDDSRKFVASGRFAYQKGFDILVEAFDMVRKRLPSSKLYILGNYEYDNRKVYDMLREYVDRNGLRDCVIFAGYTDNPFAYIKHADVFVLSSRWEGCPNVVLEAKYVGTPVAAARCIPVIGRLIDEGRTGCLAESENPRSLAEAMIKATSLEHGEGGKGVAVNNPKWMELFNR